MSFWFRFAVPVLAAALVWFAAGNAHAAAPFCDSRGATSFAPNPTLEEPNTSVDIGQADDCAKTLDDLAYQHGRGPSAADSGEEAARASIPRALAILPATPTGSLAEVDVTRIPSRSDRDRIERPPR